MALRLRPRPGDRAQRCTNHKTMNVVDKLPVKERPEYTKRLRAIWQASSESASPEGAYAATLRSKGVMKKPYNHC